MAVLPMKKISIYGLKDNRKKILELIQRRGVVEISDVSVGESTVFAKTDTQAARTTFESNLKVLGSALETLDSYVKPETSMLSMLEGRDAISLIDYEKAADGAAQAVKTARRICGLAKQIADHEADIVRYETSIEALRPWVGLDVSMRILGTGQSAVFIGTLPDDYTEERLNATLAQALPECKGLEAEVISHGPQQTCIFVLCHAKYGMQLESALRAIGLSYPPSPSKIPPKERMGILGERIAKAKAEIATAEEEIRSYKELRQMLLYTTDYLTMRNEKYEVLGKLWQSRHVFIICGYIPAEECEALQAELGATFTCSTELEEPGEKEDVPVKLKNGKFAAPVESVIESYSLPGKKEVDPSGIMAIFYYFLFGMMLSDAAYGLIMVAGCGIVLLKFKNIEESMRKTVTMFFYCGISTTFWGLMFGSFFGDAIEVISKTFFGTTIMTPCLWYRPLDDPMRLLMFSLLLGVIHLFAGLAVQFYQLVRQGLIKDAIYDVIFWYFLVGGGIVYLLSTEMFSDMTGIGFTLPAIAGTIAAVFAGIGAVGIVFTAGRESKSPGKRLLKGIYGLYGVSSYLSDILSYSRLLALGLATGVIASVFNQMGAMAGGGVLGVVVFIIAFAVGHTLNIGINLLGAYVHSNRLEFVEFFGKFYQGGGRKFSPFSAKTKHFKITEDK